MDDTNPFLREVGPSYLNLVSGILSVGELPRMNVSEFAAKWRKVELTERSASQQHFLDLCEVFEHGTPAEADPTGESFTFEKGAAKHGGGQGWADVWKRNFFGWEYKASIKIWSQHMINF